MTRAELKHHVVDLLLDCAPADLPGRFVGLPQKSLINALFSCLCHPRERVRWQAVSGFGLVVPKVAGHSLEEARTIMRRFLWMLNDESGGIGWGVPEAMAEVLFHCRPLAAEYLHMLVSYTLDDGPELFQHGNFIELEALQEGVLWGLCRVAPAYPVELGASGLKDSIGIYFRSSNPAVKGLACRLAGLLGLDGFRVRIGAALSDERPMRLYLEGDFRDCRVADLAAEALARLSTSSSHATSRISPNGKRI